MLKKFGVVLAVLVLLLGIWIQTRPAAFRIERSATIKASPAQVAALLTDFHAWEGWSPWAKLDPKMKTTYSGAATGVGAVYEWTSADDQVGAGRMTITEVKPDEHVAIKLEFLKPFAASNLTEFNLVRDAEFTLVTWRMSGANDSFVGKAFSMVMNMDQQVGGDFDKGLAALKHLAEEAAAKAAAPPPEPAPEGDAAAEPADAGTP
jgi:uncharacterized protein YndB with AHSA1/START domain